MLQNNILIRKGTAADETALKILYRRVAAIPGGLARTPEEVTDEFMHSLISNGVNNGMLLVAEQKGTPVGMLVVFRAGLKVWSHVLKDLVLLVDPSCQGRGIGTALIKTLQNEIIEHHPDIMRVELFTRETNPALRLYERTGFVQEGRFEKRVRNPDGAFVADIPLVWCNPNFAKN